MHVCVTIDTNALSALDGLLVQCRAEIIISLMQSPEEEKSTTAVYIISGEFRRGARGESGRIRQMRPAAGGVPPPSTSVPGGFRGLPAPAEPPSKLGGLLVPSQIQR